MRTEKGTAFIFRINPYLESDILVTFYSREFGLFNSLIRGVKKSSKGLAGKLMLFSEVYFERNVPRDQSFLTCTVNIDLKNSINLSDLDQLSLASFTAEALMKIIPQDYSHDRVYKLIENSFYQLSLKSSPLLPSIYLVKLFSLLGFLPEFSHCSSCGKKFTVNDLITWDMEGDLLCGKCSDRQNNLVFNEIKILSFWQKYSFSDALKVEIDNSVLTKFNSFLEQELNKHLKSKLKSIKILHDLGLF